MEAQTTSLRLPTSAGNPCALLAVLAHIQQWTMASPSCRHKLTSKGATAWNTAFGLLRRAGAQFTDMSFSNVVVPTGVRHHCPPPPQLCQPQTGPMMASKGVAVCVRSSHTRQLLRVPGY